MIRGPLPIFCHGCKIQEGGWLESKAFISMRERASATTFSEPENVGSELRDKVKLSGLSRRVTIGAGVESVTEGFVVS